MMGKDRQVTPDVPTLLLAVTLLDAFLALLMFLHGWHRKSYPGFGLWTVAALVFALGYGTLLARIIVPLEVSRLLSAFFVSLAALLRLDGTMQFVRGRAMPRAWYAVPLVMVGGLVGLVRLGGGPPEVNLVLSLFVCGSLLVGSWIFFNARAPGLLLFRAAGTLETIATLAILGRALHWLLHPDTTLLTGMVFQGYFFCLVILTEVGLTSVFLLLCSLRLETELADSRKELHTALDDLKLTVANLKILRGLLSICSYCKKIQVTGEQWQQFEVYVRNHSEADFSHGICPDCVTENFPEVAEQILGTRPAPRE